MHARLVSKDRIAKKPVQKERMARNVHRNVNASMVLNVARKLASASVRPAGWDISVIDRAMKITSEKIVSNCAIVRMQEHAMHKTEHALVAQVGLVKPAIRNVNLECLATTVRRNANAISITQFIVMESMAVVFVKHCGEVSVRNISVTHTKPIAILSILLLLFCRYRKRSFHNKNIFIFATCFLKTTRQVNWTFIIASHIIHQHCLVL